MAPRRGAARRCLAARPSPPAPRAIVTTRRAARPATPRRWPRRPSPPRRPSGWSARPRGRPGRIPLPAADLLAVAPTEVADLVEVVDGALEQQRMPHRVAELGAPGQPLAVVGREARHHVVDAPEVAALQDLVERQDRGD